jgi:perosamine synthetase
LGARTVQFCSGQHGMKVLNPPYAGAHLIGEAESEAAAAIVRSGTLFRYGSAETPSACDRLEAALSSWLGRPTYAVNSGTAGLRAALAAAGVVPGDTVLVSAFTFIASASAVLAAGAFPEPVDIGPRLEVDLEDLDAKLPGAKAIIGVYAPGHPSNMAAVAERARDSGLALIEDACQALGVTTKGARSGTIGDFGAFSFQQGKQLCAGEGGAVAANESRIAGVKRFADHGADRAPDNRPVWDDSDGGYGDNLRMTEMQAAVLLVQLGKLDQMLDRQRQIHVAMSRQAKGRVRLARSLDPEGHSGNHLLLVAPNEEKAALAIEIARKYNIYLQWAWRKPFFDTALMRRRFPDRRFSAPQAQNLAGRILSIPIPPLNKVDSDAFLLAGDGMLNELGRLWA